MQEIYISYALSLFSILIAYQRRQNEIWSIEKAFTWLFLEICHLEDGAHFGEVALLVADQRRVASVIAIEVCEVYRLDRKDFRQCIDVHSELFAEMERIATERVERTIKIEEQHKRLLMRSSHVNDYVQNRTGTEF